VEGVEGAHRAGEGGERPRLRVCRGRDARARLARDDDASGDDVDGCGGRSLSSARGGYFGRRSIRRTCD